MTNLFQYQHAGTRTNLTDRRTRISCTRHPPTLACAAFSKESRMKFADATKPAGNPGKAHIRPEILPVH